MTRVPTDEQAAAIEAVAKAPESVMMNAYAGCAKSTTLEMAAPHSRLPTLMLSFNKKNADEAKGKFPGNFTIKTMNGLGHAAWGQATGKNLKLDDKKLGKIVSEVAKDYKVQLSGEQWDGLRRYASAVMTAGIVPQSVGPQGLVPDEPLEWARVADSIWLSESDTDFLTPLAQEVIKRDIALAREGTISFDDQVYCSALLGGKFPKFPCVFVDEAQDLSQLNHRMIQLASVGRIVAVGDQKQAIYAFRGASHDSISRIRKLREGWVDRPLTLTFRCPKAVVRRQQSHAPGFRAHSSNEEGTLANWRVEQIAEDEARLAGERDSWRWAEVQALTQPGWKTAILCRNNAPLLKMAFSLIRQGIGVQMLGRDIGKNLIALSRTIAKADETPADTLLGLIENWRMEESALASANGHEERIAGINDRADCLLAVLESASCPDAGNLRTMLTRLFERTDGITLSSIYRAKGLEWDLGIHLDPWRIPSKWALKPGHEDELQQELNLAYVCDTRFRRVVISASVSDFR